MAEGKRYYWLRLHDDFFTSARVKKLRKMAGGDTYLIIYLKMQLKAMKTDGVLRWTGLEDNFADELALDLDEEPDNVKVCLAYLLTCGLAETDDQINFFFPYAVANVGSETSAAERMRQMRKRNNVTPMLRERYGEKEIETRDIETDIDRDTEKNNLSIFLSDEKKRERILHFREELERYKRLGFDTHGIYALAEAEGITKDEVDGSSN